MGPVSGSSGLAMAVAGKALSEGGFGWSLVCSYTMYELILFLLLW